MEPSTPRDGASRHRGGMVRLFVAAYPPREAAEAMLAALRRLAVADHRESPVEQVHLTLAFLGDRRVSDLDDVTESVGRAASGLPPITATPLRLVTLPGRGIPRLVACETDAPPILLELQSRLALRLLTPRERSRFLPHLTLARFKPYAQPGSLDMPCGVPAFEIRRVSLVRSNLLPTGAVHREVAGFDLER